MDAKVGAVRARLESSSVACQKLEGGASTTSFASCSLWHHFKRCPADLVELAGIIEARQRLDSQLNENEQVLKEFALLKSHNTVFKLVGPSLVPQDQAEAKGNVEKRIEFIKKEMSVPLYCGPGCAGLG